MACIGGRQRCRPLFCPKIAIHLGNTDVSNSGAITTQADVARAICACRQAGLTVIRVTVRSTGVSLETSSGFESVKPLDDLSVSETAARHRIS